MKARGWKCVIHNVKNEPKTMDQIVQWIKGKNSVWFANSIEPYPEDESRFHVHIFVAFKRECHFTAILKELKRISARVGTVKLEGETRDWNRVQVDKMNVRDMKKTFDDTIKYLQGETKEKPIGEIVIGKTKPCHRGVRYINSHKVEEFCRLCKSSECTGCCKATEPMFSFKSNSCYCVPEPDIENEKERLKLIQNNDKKIKDVLKLNYKRKVTYDPEDPFALPKVEYI